MINGVLRTTDIIAKGLVDSVFDRRHDMTVLDSTNICVIVANREGTQSDRRVSDVLHVRMSKPNYLESQGDGLPEFLPHFC